MATRIANKFQLFQTREIMLLMINFHKTLKNSKKIYQEKDSEFLNEKPIVIFRIKKFSDQLIEQTQTKAPETLEIRLK